MIGRRSFALGTAALLTCAPGLGSAQPAALPMGDAPVHIEDGGVIATALGLVPDGDASLAARRLTARSSARARALAMLHVWLDAIAAGGRLTPRVVRDLHAAIDARADLRRIRSRADGSAVIELRVPVTALAEIHCASTLPWCG